MGYAISWCAVPEAAAECFLNEAGFVDSGETEEVPESAACMAFLDTGWRLFWYNDFNGMPFNEAQRRRISSQHDLVYCRIEEHEMFSSAEFWKAGACEWKLSHEGINGSKGLECMGNPPDVFPQIKAQMEEQQRAAGGDQADVDYLFEIPLLVAKSITGFKHDDSWTRIAGGSFHVINEKSRRRGVLAWLFKR